MTAENADLLHRIDAFDIDGPNPVDLPFAARLAREHGWSRAYAARVIREYKRFVYLAMTAGQPVCPSEDVDAAWHLHLTYTRSYWHRFCNETLGRPLHHDPTRGGSSEADKHVRMYAFTFAAYRQAFGTPPPADVWPDAESRFGDDAKQRVVNTARNWVVSKSVVRRGALGIASAAAVVLFATGCVGGFNPFDLVGASYLTFLIPMLVAAAVVGVVLRPILRRTAEPAGDGSMTLDWESAAVLAGGTPRLMTAAIARLREADALRVSEAGNRLKQSGPRPDGLTKAENIVFNALPLSRTDQPAMRKVARDLGTYASDIEAKLRDDGLLYTPEQAKSICVKSALPYLAVFLGLGVSRLVLGFFARKPIWFLVVTLFIGLIPLIGLLCSRPRVTRRGDRALDALRSAGTPDGSTADVAMLVALGGTAALAGTAYIDLQNWYPRQSNGSSSGCGSGCSSTGSGCSSGGGDGGGSGCGSGCGGCGGGGGD